MNYAEVLITHFLSGVVPDATEGCTLRAFLASKLCCAPTRIEAKLERLERQDLASTGAGKPGVGAPRPVAWRPRFHRQGTLDEAALMLLHQVERRFQAARPQQGGAAAGAVVDCPACTGKRKRVPAPRPMPLSQGQIDFIFGVA